MKNQTARRPEGKGTTRSARSKYNNKQTAHVEARRDGQPLIFGWGGHLSRAQKTQLQRLGVWTFIGFITFLIIVVIAAFWINFNIIIPNLSVANVNGQTIPQSDYRKLVALKGQIAENTFKGRNGTLAQEASIKTKSTDQQKVVDADTKKVNDLTTQIKALPKNSNQLTDLQNQLTAAKTQQTSDQKIKSNYDSQYASLNQTDQLQEQLFTQSQIGTESVQWLQEDIVIRNWLSKQSTAIQNKVNPTSNSVNQALNAVKANLPRGTTYNGFLQNSNVSDADLQSMMTLIQRRNNMQNYLASQITSPTRQVQARDITLSTQSAAANILKQLKANGDFNALAKAQSLDSNTKTKGGELGWLAPGQYMLSDGANTAATVDSWISDPARTANELSPVLSENGTFHIVQIENIDPSHAIDSATLKSLQGNALKYWIEVQKVHGVKFSDPDSTMLFDASNVPSWIPQSPPTTPTPQIGSTTGQ
ncbi:peptidylprolyl isomerase [Dictyobacter arantiisoli]|uniref:PpiC domain-containing protein n=1 Tax=Dictyobacter arantiisoli TaxID=2014874 RepID=A0A5A5TCR5_9CHLR|nr:peptidylprolyl isomerase [Dictyobacter arantiisoli]GCF09310.1 hypothetical protein KDI_28740 [Dictyobacter arantiisoli]